jgi:septal ring factor EnvC (AmiA/AmiB activator)
MSFYYTPFAPPIQIPSTDIKIPTVQSELVQRLDKQCSGCVERLRAQTSKSDRDSDAFNQSLDDMRSMVDNIESQYQSHVDKQKQARTRLEELNSSSSALKSQLESPHLYMNHKPDNIK